MRTENVIVVLALYRGLEVVAKGLSLVLPYRLVSGVDFGRSCWDGVFHFLRPFAEFADLSTHQVGSRVNKS